MFENISSSPARRTARRCSIFAALALATSALLTCEAAAATARVRWLPSGSPGATRYDVYVRDAGAPYSGPTWSGNPVPDADGALEVLVPFSVAPAGANYFAVVVVGATGESELSRELWVGTPIACHVDSCTAKTTCDFGNAPDGMLCDAATTDPCSAACVDGACDTTAGADGLATEFAIDRWHFMRRSSDVALSLKGEFTTEAVLDMSTGAMIELRRPDGKVLYASAVTAASFIANDTGRRFHFDASKAESDPAWNGLTRLDFRQRGSQWIVTAHAKTPALVEASDEPALTLVARFGATCVRRLEAECERKATDAICR